MANIVISGISLLLMFIRSSHTEDTVTITHSFCLVDDSRRYEIASGDSMIIEWNGEKSGKYDWDFCSLYFSGTDRKIADLEEWTLCIETEEFRISNCDVEVEYRHGLILMNEAKAYNCSTLKPEKFCTTEMTLNIILTAPETSSSKFKLKVTATEDKTDKIVEDVMFYVKIGLGAAAALLILGAGLVILCVYCHKKRSRNANAGTTYYQPPRDQYAMQTKPV